MKKLLILGSSVGSKDILMYAQSKGVYTYLTDNLPLGQSTAKRFADEGLDISTTDINQLITFVKENSIDVVFAGVSEFNIECARKISEALNKPFYYSKKQWNTFMNKGNFREECLKYGVSTPKTFFVGNRESLDDYIKNSIIYPVIIKPVDNRANVGISIIYKKSDLNSAIELAINKSESGTIIIEQYIDGPEISTTYVIQDHNCKLVCMGTKYAYKDNNGLQALAHGYIYPSTYLDEYLEKVDENIKKMIIENGINDCTIFFQGIYYNHEFYIFEAGLRMEGTATYRITETFSGQSFMKFMIDRLLNEKTTYNVDYEDPTFGGKKCFIFSLISKDGKIEKIEGIDKISDNKNIISFEQRYNEGATIIEDGTLRQIVFRFVIKNDDIQKVINTINWLKETVKAYDSNGNNLLIQSFDPVLLAE